MGDHATETIQRLQNRRDDEKYARDHFLDTDGRCLALDEESLDWILNHIDCFVSQSRGNKRVEGVIFYPYALHGYDGEVWDKVGQAIGNLEVLEELQIPNHKFHDDDDELVVPIPDWERLARILSHMRQKIKVNLYNYDDAGDEYELWTEGEAQGLARAIRGHPTITSFDSCYNLLHEESDKLYSALATLPALESISLFSMTEHESNLESLNELLRVPSLRSVCFNEFDFTGALCQATAKALMEGTVFTSLEFNGCFFSAGECLAMITNGLGRKTSVISLTVTSRATNAAVFDALAAALPLKLTLQELSVGVAPFDDSHLAHVDWSPIFLALGRNTRLKSLNIANYFGSMDESLCTAIQNGLGTNTTLERLELQCVPLRDDTAGLWCRALSFLRTNKSLKYLAVGVQHVATESCVSAFRIDIAAMLQENASLESLSIQKIFVSVEAEVYIEIVTMLQHNTTLKKLDYGMLSLTNEEDKRIAKSLQKNYAMESLPNIVSRSGDVSAILRLNAAGRRYLIEDGSSVSKGVEVLSAVRSDINCVFFHLLENPTLCDRSAVEIVSTVESNSYPIRLPAVAKENGSKSQCKQNQGIPQETRLLVSIRKEK
jgi:hypothetical protein